MKKLASDRGTTLIFVAGAMLMISGFAAIAVDVGHRWVERRQDQSAADMGVMAGSIDLLNGVASIRDQGMSYVRKNLVQTYSDADWQTSWETCTDPTKNAGGSFAFQAVPAPAGWGVATLDCFSIDPAGFVRVRVPDQFIDTTFGNVIGVAQLQSTANAISRFAPRGLGGVLPFGIGVGVGEGEHVCLSSGPSGLAQDPCDGAITGNFGTLKGRMYGNPAIPTPENCTSSPLGDTLAVNIAAGIDHIVIPDPPNTATEVRDECFNLLPNTLNTDTGFPNNGAEQGLATGPITLSPTIEPRLQQGSNPTETVVSYNLDDKPLWEYLNYAWAGSGPGGLASCGGFDGGSADWDPAIPGLEPNLSWEHMRACLAQHVSSGSTTVIFSASLAQSPRFAYIPQFHDPDLGTGSSWIRIKKFKSTWLQGTWWKKGANWIEFHPGEDCTDGNGTFLPDCIGTGGGWAMKQLTGLVVPDAALPYELRGDPPPGSGLDPYTIELYR